MKIIPNVWIAFLLSSLILDNFGDINSKNAPIVQTNPVTVRESTVDLQVRVGDKIYVFGKSQGTLDKVKVGMQLLTFSQNQKIEGINADFKQVTWKRLKDGSVQIQSSYEPWPSLLTWLVLPDGRLKMEASSSQKPGILMDNIGLGFDLPEMELKSMAFNNQVFNIDERDPASNFFNTVNFEFDYVKLSIQSEVSVLAMNTHFITKDSNQPDVVISFPSANSLPGEATAPGLTVSESLSPKPVSKNLSKMILWFDFH
jgi:hypothetical protein